MTAWCRIKPIRRAKGGREADITDTANIDVADGSHTTPDDVHSRYTGTQTPADKQFAVWQLTDLGLSQKAIAQTLHMDPRTVHAVIARRAHVITDARQLLTANAYQFASDAITASEQAARRGKLEGISAMLDRLGVTEPPKAQVTANVGVQVVLNGGHVPSELTTPLYMAPDASQAAPETAPADTTDDA